MRVTIQTGSDNRTYSASEWNALKPFWEYEADTGENARRPVPCSACGRHVCGFWLCPHCGANLGRDAA